MQPITGVVTHKTLEPIDIGIIVVYFIVVFAIGFYFSMRERTGPTRPCKWPRTLTSFLLSSAFPKMSVKSFLVPRARWPEARRGRCWWT